MGNHSYGAAGGFTPDAVVDYIGKGTQQDVNFWPTGYNQLVNVAEYEPDGAPGYQVRLTADPGFLVRLESFDVGNFGGQITIPAIRVLDQSGQPLFSQTNFVLGASSGPHSNFTFSLALMDSSLTIDFDLSGLGGNSDNVGLDNVRFGQD